MRVVTLNLRQDLDRWSERLPLVVEALAGAAADVIALQEVALPIGQDRLLADLLADTGRSYAVHTAPKWGDQAAEAVSLLTSAPARDHVVLRLPGDGARVAQRLHVAAPGGDIVVVNTHLHHLPLDDESVRRPQAEAVLSWLDHDGLLERAVLVGDLNATPASTTLATLRGRLASLLPDGTPTFPTPLTGPLAGPLDGPLAGRLADGDLAPRQIDHVLVGPGLEGRARLFADQAHPHDPTLWPSDHLGLVGDIT